MRRKERGARETRVCPRAHVLCRALLRSVCYTAICLVVFKLQNREPTLLLVNYTYKLNEREKLTFSVLAQK